MLVEETNNCVAEKSWLERGWMRPAGRFSWIVNLHLKLPNPTFEVNFCQNTNAVQRFKAQRLLKERYIRQKAKGHKVANVFYAIDEQ